MPYTHPEPLSLQQTTAHLYLHRRCSNTVLSQSMWDPWVLCAQGLFEPSEHLWQKRGLILSTSSPLLPSHRGFCFALGHGVSPHSRSSACHLTGVFLTLDMGYLLTAAPAPCSCHCISCTYGSEPVKSYPTFCDPMDYSLPGSSVHGISQARTLEWVAISYSRGSFRFRDQT